MSSWRLLVVAGCFVLTSGYLRLVASNDIVPAATDLRSVPMQLDGWLGRDHPRLDSATEATLQADDYLLRTYTRGGDAVTLFVAYYASQRSGHTIHSPLNCLPGTGWDWIDRTRERLGLDAGREIEINRNVAQKDGQRALVYYWYQSRARVMASDYRNKLALVHDQLTRHRSDGALVRVTSNHTDPRAAAAISSFIRSAYVSLTEHLPE